MAWCRQATSHYPSQCWPRSVFLHWATRPQWIKTFPFYDSRCRGISLAILRFESFLYYLRPLTYSPLHAKYAISNVYHSHPSEHHSIILSNCFLLFYFISLLLLFTYMYSCHQWRKNMDCYKMESDIETLSQIVDGRSHNEENMSPSTVLAD